MENTGTFKNCEIGDVGLYAILATIFYFPVPSWRPTKWMDPEYMVMTMEWVKNITSDDPEQTQNTWGTHGDRPTTTTGLPKVAEETPTRMIQQVQFTDDEDDELLGANSKPKEGDPFAEDV